ncbi:MAG: hypothetical protein ABH841_02245 [Candidatus Nealsonbacteria bacterium]
MKVGIMRDKTVLFLNATNVFMTGAGLANASTVAIFTGAAESS